MHLVKQNEELKKLHEQVKLEGMFNISNEDYHSGPGISSSPLKEMSKTPAHYQQYISKVKEDQKALRDGRRIHCAVLEPEEFDKRYVIEVKHTGEGSRAKNAEFRSLHNGKEFCTQEEKDQAFALRDALMKDPQIKMILDNGVKEMSAYTYDADTGLLLKARPDIILSSGIIIDLKTTSDASEHEAGRSIFNWQYYFQAAFHLSVVNQALLCNKNVIPGLPDKVDTVGFIIVEKEAPYAYGKYEISIEDLKRGIEEYKQCLDRLKNCEIQNNWERCYTPEGFKKIKMSNFGR